MWVVVIFFFWYYYCTIVLLFAFLLPGVPVPLLCVPILVWQLRPMFLTFAPMDVLMRPQLGLAYPVSDSSPLAGSACSVDSDNTIYVHTYMYAS